MPGPRPVAMLTIQAHRPINNLLLRGLKTLDAAPKSIAYMSWSPNRTCAFPSHTALRASPLRELPARNVGSISRPVWLQVITRFCGVLPVLVWRAGRRHM